MTFSALRSGGFHPLLAEYTHANNAAFYILALGGIRVLLPEHEIDDAKAWMAYLRSQALPAETGIKPRKYGRWIRGTVLFSSTFNFLPILFIPPLILYALWFCVVIVEILFTGEAWGTFFAGFFVLLLLHAKYIAGPKLIKGQNHVT